MAKLGSFEQGYRAQPVELFQDADSFSLGPNGKNFAIRAVYLPVTDAIAADAALFSMKVAAGNFGVYITDIWGTLTFNGTTTAASNGLYFERHSGILTHTGGTQITPVSFDYGEASGLSDCQFKISAALTATSVNYEGAKFASSLCVQTNGAQNAFFVPLPRNGLYLPPGVGLAGRLEAQSLGLAMSINIHYTKVAIDTASGR